MKKVEMIAQFNKLNKKFITLLGYIPDISLLNHENYLYREVLIDPENEALIGNYDEFSIELIAEQPQEIYEHHMDSLAKEKIVSRYPIEKQLNVIAESLEKLLKASGDNSTELTEMRDYINEVRRVNEARKKYFEESEEFDYISDEKLDREINEKYIGGINGYGEEILN